MIKEISLLLTVVSTLAFAQKTDLISVTYVDNAGQTKNGFTTQQNLYKGLKNFTFRETKEGKDIILMPNDVASISFSNGDKYIASTVNISRHNDANLTEENKANYTEETLFLRTIIEGNVNLYEYVDNSGSVYFAKANNDTQLQQLQYRRYYQDGNVVTDNTFKNQLTKLFSGTSSGDLRDLRDVRYNYKSLTNFFGSNNGVGQSSSFTYKANEKKKGYFTFGVVAGVTNSTLDIKNTANSYQKGETYDLSNVGFRVGVDVAYHFPFSNNLSVFAQPSFQNFSVEYKANYDTSKTMTLDYNTIQIPLGLRYSVINAGVSKVYLSGMFQFNIPMSAKVENINLYASASSHKEEFKSVITGAFGVGYQYNNKLSAEVRYTLPADIFKSNNANTGSWTGDMSQVGLVLGYRLF